MDVAVVDGKPAFGDDIVLLSFVTGVTSGAGFGNNKPNLVPIAIGVTSTSIDIDFIALLLLLWSIEFIGGRPWYNCVVVNAEGCKCFISWDGDIADVVVVDENDDDDIAIPILVSNFIFFVGTTVLWIKFLNRPTFGSISSGLITISSSLNVTPRLFRPDLLDF